MKKSKAIVILLCAVLLLAGIAYIDFYGLDATGKGSASDIKLGLDLAGGVSITYQVVGDGQPSATDMRDTINKLQKRVENYSTEAIVYQEGADRINIEIPGVDDEEANRILQELGQPGQLYFIAQTDEEGNENYTQVGVDENGERVYMLNKSIEQLEADGSIKLVGTDVKSAEGGAVRDQMQNIEYVVNLVMTEEGTQKFADATQRAYQRHETLAIY